MTAMLTLQKAYVDAEIQIAEDDHSSMAAAIALSDLRMNDLYTYRTPSPYRKGRSNLHNCFQESLHINLVPTKQPTLRTLSVFEVPPKFSQLLR